MAEIFLMIFLVLMAGKLSGLFDISWKKVFIPVYIYFGIWIMIIFFFVLITAGAPP